MQKIDAISLLPQSPPFIFVDHLVFENDSYHSELLITEKIPLLNNGFLTEGGMIEHIAQTLAAIEGKKSFETQDEIKNGYIGAIKNFNIISLPKIGDKISTYIESIKKIANISVITCSVKIDTKSIASCELRVFLEE